MSYAVKSGNNYGIIKGLNSQTGQGTIRAVQWTTNRSQATRFPTLEIAESVASRVGGTGNTPEAVSLD